MVLLVELVWPGLSGTKHRRHGSAATTFDQQSGREPTWGHYQDAAPAGASASNE